VRRPLSYAPDFTDRFRRAATVVDKILKRAKPADLPWEQPTKFELVINPKTAKALSLAIPQSLRAQAELKIHRSRNIDRGFQCSSRGRYYPDSSASEKDPPAAVGPKGIGSQCRLSARSGRLIWRRNEGNQLASNGQRRGM